MRILFLSPWFPARPDNGIRIRLYHLLRALAHRHEIDLLSFLREGDIASTDGLSTFCASIKMVPWNRFNPNRFNALRGFFSPQPRSVVDTYSTEMADLVREAGREKAFDVVIAATTDMAPYAVKANARIRLLEEHNSMTGWMKENFLTQSSSFKRARAWLTFQKHRRFESRLYRKFDACTMVSENDAQNARTLLSLDIPIRVIPNGVDLDANRYQAFSPKKYTLIYNGSLTYSANLDAMQYFVAEIWQRIKDQSPQATLKITGSTEGVATEAFINVAGITFTGYVQDIASEVGSSWVCVTPIRTGSGTRLKILEAMAVGTPVVSTTKGGEGLKVRHGENIFIADQPDDFADHVLSLLHDKNLRDRIALCARRLVEAEYGWDQSGAKFESFLREIEERKR